MQIHSQYSSPHLTKTSHLPKTASMSSIDTQAPYTSASSISSTQSKQEEYWKSASKWIIKLRKRINVSKSTIYLTISYLWKLLSKGCTLNENNYQKISATLLLLSAKMNEIYPPNISSLITKCSQHITHDEIIQTQAWILTNFDFDMTFPQITYSFLAQILDKQTQDKLEDCQKLLGLAVTDKTIMKSGEEIVALGVVYLIKPSIVRDIAKQNLKKIKLIANKIYNLYIANKAQRT